MVAWTPVQDLLPSHDRMAANVISAFEAADKRDLNEGLNWYDTAHYFAGRISGGDPVKGAGVIAALSPQKAWLDNQYLAARAFETGVATGQVFRANRVANRILAGESPWDALGGRKVRSFFRLIADPSDDLSVCVDRHAFDIAVGEVTDDKSRKILERKGGYSCLASVYRTAARDLQVLPSQVQAVTWVHWRNTKGQ